MGTIAGRRHPVTRTRPSHSNPTQCHRQVKRSHWSNLLFEPSFGCILYISRIGHTPSLRSFSSRTLPLPSKSNKEPQAERRTCQNNWILLHKFILHLGERSHSALLTYIAQYYKTFLPSNNVGMREIVQRRAVYGTLSYYIVLF